LPAATLAIEHKAGLLRKARNSLDRHFKDTTSGDDGFDWSEIECLLRRAYWSLKAAVADG
jgi:hypothetical protein